MSDLFTLEIATPERLLVSELASEAQIPARGGEIGGRPLHAPLITELGIGTLTYVAGGRRRQIAISGGVAELQPSRVRVLDDAAEPAEEIDPSRAQEALRRASQRLAGPALGVDVGRALNALRRAQNRLRAAGLSQ